MAPRMQWMLTVVCYLAFSHFNVIDTASICNARRGPLVDYVYRPDPNYEWSEYSRTPTNGLTTVYLNMTSQQWYDETLTNQPIWRHYVVVHIPDNILYRDAALLYIGGDSNPGPPDTTDSKDIITDQFARETGIVAVTLFYIPNQPLVMENDGKQRVEDDIISWTWRRYYNQSIAGTVNPEIIANLPMCKASVRAMDAVQEFMQRENGNAISKFMLAGRSKRGWTTWLTGAIDDRVVAMAPVVFSWVNMIPTIRHYRKSLGAWSFALYDYWSQGLMGLLDTPEVLELAKIVDPWQYRKWLIMPKLMISAASDEFFMLDDYNYFFDDLRGEKYIWIMENTGHDVSKSPSYNDFLTMLQTFYIGVLQGQAIPGMKWDISSDANGGSITVDVSVTPLNISAWWAPSVLPDRRDFRLFILDQTFNPTPSYIVWTEQPVNDLGNGRYAVDFENPSSGYLAFFIKVRLPGPDGREYILSTEANIIPPTFPYPDCSGSGCQGSLV